MSKAVLITGATGQQGGSVIDALLASPLSDRLRILAVTRDVSSQKAQSLVKKSPQLQLVEGDLNDVSKLFDPAMFQNSGREIWGVFSVQNFMGKNASVATEEMQGKALVDESIKRGVSHFVCSSVERGDDERSWDNETDIPHFISKHRIEWHLRNATGPRSTNDMTWTILRPTTFMENVKPGFFLKVFATTWRVAVGRKPLQMVATSDIGWFGAQALLDPDSWRDRAVGLVGDELTWDQFRTRLKRRLDIHCR